MMKRLFAVAVLMTGLVFVGAPSQAAPVSAPTGLKADTSIAVQVRHGRIGARHWGGNRHWGGRGHLGRHRHWGHHRHWRGGYRWWGPAVGIGIYSGYAYSGCGWLYRRAVNTGSRYWWRRYRDCRGW